MHGNVWEWCLDPYHRRYYRDSPTDDPAGPRQSDSRVTRGASWIDDPRDDRMANRGALAPERRGSALGFRVARGQPESTGK
jgi:sulfatase modifying factor 1